MLHELNGHLLDNQYHPRPPKPTDFALLFDGQHALLIEEGGMLRLPRFSDFVGAENGARFLFFMDNDAFFLISGVNPSSTSGFVSTAPEVFRTFTPAHMGFAGVLGMQLFRFYTGNRFCGRCGTETRHSDKERALVCPSCENTIYPKLSPAVIVGVTDGERLLLTKYAGRVQRRHALVAGFAEFGEPIEDTVSREVLEEVGLKVQNIRYFKSQPWPFSDTLLMGFFCDLCGEDKITLEENELAEATWFKRDELPATENRISLTNTMIEAFRAGDHLSSPRGMYPKVGNAEKALLANPGSHQSSS